MVEQTQLNPQNANTALKDIMQELEKANEQEGKGQQQEGRERPDAGGEDGNKVQGVGNAKNQAEEGEPLRRKENL